MIKEIWINLPVKDVSRSKNFFTQIGFALNPKYDNGDESACIMLGSKNIVIMLFKESVFSNFTGNQVADSKAGNEVLLSFDAESREEVDEMARKAEAAGGQIFGKPAEIQGWMYGCGFVDLDGHRWNALYMDQSKMPKR